MIVSYKGDEYITISTPSVSRLIEDSNTEDGDRHVTVNCVRISDGEATFIPECDWNEQVTKEKSTICNSCLGKNFCCAIPNGDICKRHYTLV